MSAPTPATAAAQLPAEALRRRCDPAGLSFETTSDLAARPGLIGQARAMEALSFGLAMQAPDFNVFVAGPPGTGKTSSVRAMLEEAAPARPVPPDWCYIHNFHDPGSPRALQLPPGQGRVLRGGLQTLVASARREIPRAFESEEYIARRDTIISGINRERDERLTQLTAQAQLAGFSIQPTQMGIAIIPMAGNRPLTDEDLAGLRPEMRAQIMDKRRVVEEAVGSFLKAMRTLEREARSRLENEDRDLARHVIADIVDDLVEQYPDQPQVRAYLAEVQEQILADIDLFRSHPLPADGRPAPVTGMVDPEHAVHEQAFRKYDINVVIDNEGGTGAPVVFETNPTYPNLIGRIEREVMLGALLTDFTLIRPGALHRANGGYLVLRVADVLRAPLAWETLKRSLRERSLRIEDMSEAIGMTETRSLRPDPIPLDVRVFLIGELQHYALLHALDPDFSELFKIRADFDTEMDWTEAGEQDYAVALACATHDFSRPLDRTAVAAVIEESARLAEDQRKLSLRLGQLVDLIREAEHYATREAAPAISLAHIRQAVAHRRYRSDLIPERLREQTARGVLVIRPEGTATGQVHGLSVAGIGDSFFGRPVRITATAGTGREGVLDIERQAELGGNIHSKGMLILAGYLADTYTRDKPLVLSARLVFEQSYSEVEGDSASMAELLALLSRLADVPLRQGIAVTGSINQRGEAQAIGGANAKIEGFYDTCVSSGLTGDQGVILPASNVQHLMLREDVVAAVAAGRFHIYAVHTVDEALEILTGLPAGPRGADGNFTPDGIHARVDARLRGFGEALRAFAAPKPGRNGAALSPDGTTT